MYAGLGGMRSVVATDGWQVRIIMVSLGLIVLAMSVQSASSTHPNGGPVPSLWSQSWTPHLSMPWALIVNMLIVNVALMPSSLRVWQVVAGSSLSSRLQRSIWLSALQITIILLFAVLIGRGVSSITQGDPSTIELGVIFNYLATNPQPILAYAIYPLFVCALLAALVSTADSAILPLTQIMTRKSSPWNSFRILVKVLLQLAVVVSSYFLVTKVWQFDIVPWVLTVFSVTTCIAPAVVLPLFVRRDFSRSASLVVGLGVILGCLSAFAWSIEHRQLDRQPWNCLIGTSISLLACAIASRMPESSKPGRQSPK